MDIQGESFNHLIMLWLRLPFWLAAYKGELSETIWGNVHSHDKRQLYAEIWQQSLDASLVHSLNTSKSKMGAMPYDYTGLCVD